MVSRQGGDTRVTKADRAYSTERNLDHPEVLTHKRHTTCPGQQCNCFGQCWEVTKAKPRLHQDAFGEHSPRPGTGEFLGILQGQTSFQSWYTAEKSLWQLNSDRKPSKSNLSNDLESLEGHQQGFLPSAPAPRRRWKGQGFIRTPRPSLPLCSKAPSKKKEKEGKDKTE